MTMILGAIMMLAGATTAYTDTIALPEVLVSDVAKVNVELAPFNTNIVTETEINHSAESSLLPVLVNQVPGLFATQRGMAGYGVSDGAAGDVNIRGIGQGNKVLFMIDGQPQWAGVFGHSVADTYTANGIERVEVVKGPSSLLYGSNAMGGSINVITKRQREDGWSGRARAMFGSFSTQKFSLYTGFKSGKFSGSVAGNMDRTNGNRDNSEFWLANEIINFDYEPSANWQVGTTVNLLQSKADNPGSIYDPLLSMWTKISRGTASIHIKDSYTVANGGLQAFINWGRHKIDDGYKIGATPRDYLFNSTDYNMGFTLYQNFIPWQDNNLSAGVDFLHWGGHNWNTSKTDPDAPYTSEARQHENEVGVYVMMQQGFWSDLLSLNAGVRYQHGSQYGDQWIPQAGFILRPIKDSQIKFSFGKGFRAPNIRELYLFPPHNPDLDPEYLYNYEVELRQFLFNGKFNIGLALYYINAKNLIERVFSDGRPLNRNTGRLINKGFEIDASYIINRQWRASASYSYLHTSKPIAGAPKNKLDLEVSYNPGDFEFTLQNNNIFSIYTIAEGSNCVKESFSLLNFQAAYNIPWRTAVRLFLKLDNITNAHYDIVYGFPMPGITVLGGVELKF